jgi:DNA-binding NarL/FixJ family response regulator
MWFWQLGGGARKEPAPAPARVRVILAEHDPQAREAVREAMARPDDLIVVGEATTAAEATAAVLELAPDIVLLDADLPPEGGIAAAVQLLAAAHATRVVLLSNDDNIDVALSALAAGASGCLTKSIETRALARTLRSVARGEAAISRRLTLEAIRRLRSLEQR